MDSEFCEGSPSDDRVTMSLMYSSEAISPVLMIWLTLLCMYLVNSAADHLAVGNRDTKGVNEVSRLTIGPGDRCHTREPAETNTVRFNIAISSDGYRSVDTKGTFQESRCISSRTACWIMELTNGLHFCLCS